MSDFRDLREKVEAVICGFDPPYGHWLISDATFSYCWTCARQARWEEMGNVGPPPFETVRRWSHSDIEENIRDGIDGGFQQLPRDCPESCDTCNRTLAYWLSDYGIQDELAKWEENPDAFCPDLREDAYAIDRLFEVVSDEDKAAVTGIAERFLKHVEEEQL